MTLHQLIQTIPPKDIAVAVLALPVYAKAVRKTAEEIRKAAKAIRAALKEIRFSGGRPRQ